MAAKLIFENEFFTVEELDDGIVVLTRSNRPFPGIADIDAGCLPVQLSLAHVGRRHGRLLIDVRQAVGNNDPKFEAAFEEQRRGMVQGFQRVALVAQTTIGKLHNQRLAQADRAVQAKEIRFFLDFEEALAFLRTPLAKPARVLEALGKSLDALPHPATPEAPRGKK